MMKEPLIDRETRPRHDIRRALLANIPAVERHYELAGISTAILEGGSGRPLILLHGPLEHAVKWLRVIPDLVTTYHVIAPDLPGYGESAPNGSLDVDGMLAWLGELIDRTCDTPPILVGELLGGAIAARFASRHRERLAALVLTDTFGLAPFEPTPQLMSAYTAYMMQPTLQTHEGLWHCCAFDLDRLRARLGVTWDRLSAYTLERATDDSLRQPQETLMQQFGLPAMPAAELQSIRVPTTLIWGRHDPATRLDRAEAASRRYSWPLHVIDDAGDDPALEQPEAFISALRTAIDDQRLATQTAWDSIAAGYDRTNTPSQMWLAEEGLRLAGLRAGSSVLDVAAGSGALSIPAARAGAYVLAIDLSSRMLELLRSRAELDHVAIETRVMDAQALDLDDARFDIAASQFGVMLVPDMPRALREMARVVKPGGRVLVSAYGDPSQIDFLAFFLRAIRAVRPDFPGLPNDPPPLEFQLADRGRLERELSAAGLGSVHVETLHEVTEFATGAELWDWVVCSNPIVEHLLTMLQITSDERGIMQRTLDNLVRERANGKHAARLTNPVHIGVGTK